MNIEPRLANTKNVYSSDITHTAHWSLLSRTNFFQTALRNNFAGCHVNTQLSGRATLAAALGRRAHSHREALSLAALFVDKVLRSHSSYGDDSLDAHQ